MRQPSDLPFCEKQRFSLKRIGPALATPPCILLGLLIWQVVLGHPRWKHSMSNGDVIGWTIFLWAIFLRLITARLVTEARDGQLVISLRGFWRSRRIPFSEIRSAEKITYDPVRDYGGYGIRTGRFGKAYIAAGTRGVRIKLANGAVVVVGSQRSEELAGFLRSHGGAGGPAPES